MTDEQVPLLVEYLLNNAGALAVASGGGGAKGKGGGKGGGFAGKNLRVLTAAAVPAAMQGFVEGLGLLDKERAASATSTTGPPMKRWRE